MNDLSIEVTQKGRLAATKAKAFVSDPESEDVLRRALGDLGVANANFTRGSIATAISALAKEASPDLLIVDISGAEDPLVSIDELAARCDPEVNVIAIGDQNDIGLYRHLREVGVSDYFFKPLVHDLLKRACNNILNDAQTGKSTNARGGKLVYVLGVRGGVGATTIAVNAALRLADKGQRWVMLVDLNMDSGDAALQLGAAPTNALREALERPERVDKLFLERGTLHAGARLDILASLEPFGRSAVLKEDAILVLFDKLLQRYRYVFVDLPAFAAVTLGEALHRPSTCILVSTASLASARELVRWRDWIGPNTPERRTVHVLNMGGADNSLPDAEFVRAVGQAPDVKIPYDRATAAASNLGVTATQKCAALNQGLASVLRDLAGEPAETPRTILKRIFG